MPEQDQNSNPEQATGPVPEPMQVPEDEPPLPPQTPPSALAAEAQALEPEQMTRELPPQSNQDGSTSPSGTGGTDASATEAGGAQGGYAQAGYPQTGYAQPGYTQPGYAPGGYAEGGYASAGTSYPGAGTPPAGPPSGYPGYGYGYPVQPTRTDDKAIWALVSAIAGFILCPVVLHVVGWVLANQSLRSIRESRGALTGDGIAKLAKILSIIGVVLYSLLAVAAIAFFAILIPLGLFAASTDTTSIDVGSQEVTPTAIAEIDGRSFSHDVGDVTYDLTDLDFGGESVEMSVDLGAGTLVVEVPDEVTVTLDASVGAGQIDAFGEATSGISLTRDETSPGEPNGGSVLLDLEVDLGDLRVVQN